MFPLHWSALWFTLGVMRHDSIWSIICDFWISLRLSRPSCDPLYVTNTSHHKQGNIYEYPLPIENAKQNVTLRYYTHQRCLPIQLLKPASEHAHAQLLPRLSSSWTVLLPSDTHRKPITCITAVLL
jgi:hypothetical protein